VGGVALLPEVGREAGGGPEHHDPVHPVGPGAEGATEACGAELQGAVEPVGEVGRGTITIGEDVGDRLLELGAGVGIGVLGHPAAGAFEQDIDVRAHVRHRSAMAEPGRRVAERIVELAEHLGTHDFVSVCVDLLEGAPREEYVE
jgi:hypothetical protein